jgi:hypothetical protein
LNVLKLSECGFQSRKRKKLPGTVSGEWGMYLISTTLRFSQKLFSGMSEWPYLWDYLEQTSGKSPLSQIFIKNLTNHSQLVCGLSSISLTIIWISASL